jgi:branched-chain amino acid transport system permease protein
MTRRTAIAVAIILLLLVAVPFGSRSDYVLGVLILSSIYAVFAASWDFMSGQTGRENFGHALFIGVGAYAAAFLDLELGWPPAFTVIAGGCLAALAALIVGLPTLRLTGPYFAVATLVAASILERLTLVLWETTGGEEGLTGLAPLARSPAGRYYAALAFLVVTAGALIALARSRWGLLLRAIRGDEAAAQAAGINTTFHKMSALLVSAFAAGMAGAVYAHFQRSVGPHVFGVVLTVSVITMAYVGGIGTIYGAIAGAFLLTILTEALRQAGEFRLLVYTLVLIAIIRFFPDGLLRPLFGRFFGRTAPA